MQTLKLQRINIGANANTVRYIRDMLEQNELAQDNSQVYRVLSMVEDAFSQQLADEIEYMVQAISEGN